MDGHEKKTEQFEMEEEEEDIDDVEGMEDSELNDVEENENVDYANDRDVENEEDMDNIEDEEEEEMMGDEDMENVEDSDEDVSDNEGMDNGETVAAESQFKKSLPFLGVSSMASSTSQSASQSYNGSMEQSRATDLKSLRYYNDDSYYGDSSDNNENTATGLTADQVNSHIKGSLSFGLPKKPVVERKILSISDRNLKAAKRIKVLKKFLPVSDNDMDDSDQEGPGVSSSGLMVHRPVVPRKKENISVDHLSEELQQGYKILSELMSDYHRTSNGVYMEAIDLDPVRNKEYLQVVEKPIWLKKIRETLLASGYESITDVIRDIRIMLENAYKYYGPAHSFTKKGLRLELVMEQKLALLSKEMKEMTSLEATSGKATEDVKDNHRTKTAKISVNGDNFFSHLLHRVKGCRVQREKELKRKKMEALKQAKLNKEMEIVHWDEEFMREDEGSSIKKMWELPNIGHSIFLLSTVLNTYEVSQYELERMLILPQASSKLCTLMTSLLSNSQTKQKIMNGEMPPMPYNTWARKLAQRSTAWYKSFTREGRDSNKLFESLGIEPRFWEVCGPRNLFETTLFHNMTIHQRVWMLKTLCDCLFHSTKNILDVLEKHNPLDLREYVLGKDREGYQYINFPQFCGGNLRLYRRQNIEYDPDKMCPVKNEMSESDETAFTKDQVKEFRKHIKACKKKLLHRDDPEWEGTFTPVAKKIHKRRGRPPKNPLPSSASKGGAKDSPVNTRTRPSNLRQRPVKTYTQFIDEDEEVEGVLSSDCESNPLPPVISEVKKKRGRKRKEELMEKEEEELEEDKEEELKSPAEGTEEGPSTSLPELPITPSSLSRAQMKNPRLKKGGKKKHHCETCGKSFNQLSSLNGHLAVHTKEKMKIYSSVENSPAPTPVSESLTNSPENSMDVKKEEEKEEGEEKSVKEEENKDGEEKEEKDEPKADEKVGEGESRATTSNEGSVEATPKGSVEATPIQSDEETGSTKSSSSNENTSEPPTKKMKVSHDAIKEEIKEEVDIKEEPMEPMEEEVKKEELHDPTPYLPVDGEFELVVTSVEELRELIKKFGELPPKQSAGRKKKEGGEEEALEENKSDEEEEEEEEKEKEQSDEDNEAVSGSETEGKRPRCEVLLCKNLCQLLVELQPWEAKLQTATKKMRSQFKSEVTDWNKKAPGYVDPSEEAWMSEPEIPVEAMAPPAAKTPSPPTSSESEDEYTDDGQRKRKLRKRRAKKNMCYETFELPGSASSVQAPAVSNAAETANNEFLDLEKTLTMSSRGRIRKTKKVVDYDQLDFEKLAAQAEKETRIEKEKRKRLIDEDIENFQKEEEGERSNGSTESPFIPPKLKPANAKTFSNRPLLSTIYGPNIKSYLFNQHGEIKGYVDKNDKVHNGCPPRISEVESIDNTKLEPKIVLLAFAGEQALNVVLRGEKAMEVLKFLKPNSKFPNSPITLKQCGKSYTCPTHIEVVTKNVPGLPDSPNEFPTQPSSFKSNSIEPLATSSPIKTVHSTPSKPPFSGSHVKPNNVTGDTSNSFALAYRGLPTQQRLPENNNIFTPDKRTIPKSSNLVNNVINKSPASLRSDTTIVTATSIQSTTSALTSTPARQPVKLKLATPSNGVGSLLTPNVPRSSGSMVAVPDNSGGYTLSIASDAGNQIQPNIANIIDQLQGSSDQTNANNNAVMFAGGANTPVIAAPGSGLSPQHTAPVAGQQQKTMLVTQSGQQVVLSPGQQLVKLPNGTIRILQTVPQQQQKSPIVQQVIQGGQVVQQIIGGQLVQNVVQQPQRLNAISSANKMQYVIQQPQQQATVSGAQQQPRIVMVQQQKQVNQQNVAMQYVQQAAKQQVFQQQVVSSPMRQQTIVNQQGKVLQQVNVQQPQQYVQYQQQATPVSIQQQGSNQQQFLQVGQQMVQMGQQVIQSPQMVQQNRQIIHSNQQVVQQQQQNQQIIQNSQMVSSNPQIAQQSQQIMQQNQQIIQQSSQPNQTFKTVSTSNQQPSQSTALQPPQQRVVQPQQSQARPAAKPSQVIKVVQLHTEQGLRYAIQNENNTYTILSQEQVSTFLPKMKSTPQ